jgi:succinate dehydrogenase cytochrome b556 subunit
MAIREQAPSRPLSPHLQVYRWQITMTMSILHRVSGVALTVGALGLAGGLLARAGGGEGFAGAGGGLAWGGGGGGLLGVWLGVG